LQGLNKVASLVVLLIIVHFSISSGFGQRCRTYGFEDDSFIRYFDGDDFDISQKHYDGNQSMLIKEASPGNATEVTADVLCEEDSGLVRFFWRKDGVYADKFKLDFYIDDNKSKGECKNIREWGQIPFLRKLDGKTSHTLKWILRHDDSMEHIGTPTANASIDRLELCGCRFEGEIINWPPDKPELNKSSVNIFIGEQLTLSVSAEDPNKDNITYIWNWGDENKNESTELVSSNTTIIRNHSWNTSERYQVRVKAVDEHKNESVWSDPCFVTIEPIPSPIAPIGASLGYVNESCLFFTNVSTSFEGLRRIKYKFDWGDSTENETDFLKISEGAKASHIWRTNGEKKVRVMAFNDQNGSRWSRESTISIYRKNTVAEKLQDEINNATDYTELILNNSVYDVGEILIDNKCNLTIKSSKDYATLSGQRVNNRLRINNSKFLKITRLNLINCINGLDINNSYNIYLFDNKIQFHSIGIGVANGGYNRFQDNSLLNITDSGEPAPKGIVIDNDTNDLIMDNIMDCNWDLDPDSKILHYYITSGRPEISNNTIIVSKINDNDFYIAEEQRRGLCICKWNIDGLIPGKFFESDVQCTICCTDANNVWRY
jgi:hypothetical protein